VKKILHILFTLTAIGIISGGVLSSINSWSSPLIKENQRLETERAIFVVHNTGDKYEEITGNDFQIFKVFTGQDDLAGYSFVYEGNGFQGKIKIMIGITPDLNKITAIEVLEQTETPGLGTKILESPFIDQLFDLNVPAKINFVKAAPSSDSDVQSITGATISARAVVEIINNGIIRMRELREEGKI
jgi:Na+-translocating ferredoxin:NAD+ oxidoreductase subunit G